MSKRLRLVGQKLAVWLVPFIARMLPKMEREGKLDENLIRLLSVARYIPYDKEQRVQLEQNVLPSPSRGGAGGEV